MSFSFRRASVRVAVGLIATAIPLVGASVAQAAMAGANRLVTTSRPDLVSVVATGANSGRFCFDKPIVSIADQGGFIFGGYKSDATTNSTSATIVSSNTNCVEANISFSPWFSYGQVSEGAVRAAGNVGNRADSVALGGSTTNNGTRGRSTAPDLAGISVVQGTPQQIAFTFDEPVDASSIVGSSGFHFVTSSGTPNCAPPHPACDVSSQSAVISSTDPTTVIVQFPVGGTIPLVTNAVRGYVLPGAVTSATNLTPDGWDSQAGPGSANGVVTGVPTLPASSPNAAVQTRVAGTSDVFNPLGSSGTTGGGPKIVPCGTLGSTNCVVVDYTFNEGVSVNNSSTTLSNFYAYLSNGSYVNPAAVTEPSGTDNHVSLGQYSGSATVRAFYALPQAEARGFSEYLVKAGISGATDQGSLDFAETPSNVGCVSTTTFAGNGPLCAVVSTTTGHSNTPSEAPIGGNTGGHATGFTTAPDAFSTQFDTLTNTASVVLDQRTFAPAAGAWLNPRFAPGAVSAAQEALNFQLLDANGNAIAGGTTISSCSPSTPGFPCALPTMPSNANGPGTTTVWIVYPSPAVQVGNAKGLEIRGYVNARAPFGFGAIGGDVFNNNSQVVVNPLDPNDAPNVQQILSPTAVAAQIHHERAGKRWSHKRMTRAYLLRVLARMHKH